MTHWIENTYSILLEVPEGMTPEQYVEAHRIPSTGFIDLAVLSRDVGTTTS